MLTFVKYQFGKHDFKEHFHQNYSMGLVTDGIHQLEIHGTQKTICKNELKIINPYDMHIANGALGWTYLNIMPSFSKIKSIAQEINDDEVHEEIRFKNHIRDTLANQMFVDLFKSLNQNMAYEENLISLIAYLLEEHSCITLYPKEIPVNIQKTIEYIHTYFLEEVSLDTLALVADISKYHLIKVFKEKTGLSPHQYILRLRVEHAVFLIGKHKALPLSMVSAQSGFSDQSHFIKTFKKYNGYTPSVLIKNAYSDYASPSIALH